MKNSILTVVLALIAVGGASYTYVRRQEQKNLELEIAVRKEEALQKKAEAKRKTAEAEKMAILYFITLFSHLHINL